MSSVVESCGLDEIFAHRLAESHEFRSWLLSRTKFAKLWPLARLRSQSEKRDDRGGMVFDFALEQTALHFGLYIACAADAMELERAEAAVKRARAQAKDHMDFETVLLAPQALILNDAHAMAFDRRIPFETVAGFAPEFGQTQLIAA